MLRVLELRSPMYIYCTDSTIASYATLSADDDYYFSRRVSMGRSCYLRSPYQCKIY